MIWTKLACTLSRHPVPEINDPDDEYTVMVVCACGRRVVTNPMSVEAWKARRKKGHVGPSPQGQ